MLVSRKRLVRRLRKVSNRTLRRCEFEYTPAVYETIRQAHADALREMAR